MTESKFTLVVFELLMGYISSKNILVKALTLTLNIPIQENWFTNPLFMYHFIVYKFPVIFQLTQAKGTITKAQYNS